MHSTMINCKIIKMLVLLIRRGLLQWVMDFLLIQLLDIYKSFLIFHFSHNPVSHHYFQSTLSVRMMAHTNSSRRWNKKVFSLNISTAVSNLKMEYIIVILIFCKILLDMVQYLLRYWELTICSSSNIGLSVPNHAFSTLYHDLVNFLLVKVHTRLLIRALRYLGMVFV